MEFTCSLANQFALEDNLDAMIINSSHEHFPGAVMSFDDFQRNLTCFHEPALEPEVLDLVSNFNQPVYDFNELSVQRTKQIEDQELMESIQQDNGPSL